MRTVSGEGKTYNVDEHGFLLQGDQWDEEFARVMAPRVGLTDVLSEKHWAVIRFIRERFNQTGMCPLVYETCAANGLSWRGLRALFPSGYLRGACLLAGVTYKDGQASHYGEPGVARPRATARAGPTEKTYRVDMHGFLIDPAQWDEDYAVARSEEMGLPGGLTDNHWQVIRFLREVYRRTGRVPTLYDCCESNDLELEDLASLFPDGYHRGAVKISGLRVR